MARTEKLEFAGYEVTLNPENLRFDEHTLSQYLQVESGYYDNFGAYLALAEKNLQNKEIVYERLLAERFVEAKENGGSDKLAEAKAKADQTVNDMRQAVVEAKYVVNRLKNHLKAWDKNHDNAQSLGHTIRRQMQTMREDTIYGGPYMGSTQDRDVADAVGSFPSQIGFEDDIGQENLW